MISVIISSVRDYRWKDILNEFSVTKTEFEIIVCGPCQPQDLGPNFRCIQTNVKGAQCVEIGVRQSKGDYLFFTLDDVVHTPNILDILLERRLSYAEDLVILSPTFKQMGKSFHPQAMTFNGIGTPSIPVGMLMSKKDWDKIGGVDRNFVRCYWDHDIAMRCWAMGGKVVVFPDVFLDEVLPTLSSVWIANGRMGEVANAASFHQDRPYLLSLWTKSPALVNGKLNVARSKSFEPFVDEGIMEKDQGVQNVHKGTNQHYDSAFAEYIRTGKSPGSPDLGENND